MASLLIPLWHRAARAYHQCMLTYHTLLYRDCLDLQLREHFYRKVKYHQQKVG